MWDIFLELYWKRRASLISTDMILLIARSLQQNEIEYYTLGSEIFPLTLVLAAVVYWVVSELLQLTPRQRNVEEPRLAGDDLLDDALLNNQ